MGLESALGRMSPRGAYRKAFSGSAATCNCDRSSQRLLAAEQGRWWPRSQGPQQRRMLQDDALLGVMRFRCSPSTIKYLDHALDCERAARTAIGFTTVHYAVRTEFRTA